jgi:penicillin-insensitive murein endopeptidase
MRAERLFALLFALGLAGITPLRSDVLSPPAFAEPAPDPKSVAKTNDHKLPDFVPDGRPLTFSAENNSASPAASGKARSPAPETSARTIKIKTEPIPDAAGAETSSLKSDGATLPKWPEFVGAKNLFGKVKKPAPLSARAIGYYSRGCLSGAVPLPIDGPAWQEMRLSRNRNWGHPVLIALIERLALDAKKYDGWSGLLMGDIAQPRGGPMVSGHASHQVGLDADVWLTPMPKRRLTRKERETMEPLSMLDSTGLAVNPKTFTSKQVALIKRAASYSEVERIFVHPAIKKALCEAAGTDRKWLGKVRPYYGHIHHFHLRIKCPPGFAGCRSQTPPTGDDGCGKEVDQWLARVIPAKSPPPPRPRVVNVRPPRPPIMLSDLPAECRSLLAAAPDPVSVPSAALMTKVAVRKALAKAAAARAAFAKVEGIPIVPAKAAAAHPALRPHLNKTTAAEKGK